MSLAAIIIVSQKRARMVQEQILPVVLQNQFDEVAVVGDFWDGAGYRHIPVPPITRTTVDALIKRDAGTVATTAPVVAYFCDDHAPAPDFAAKYRECLEPRTDWDVLVPARFCRTQNLKVPLNTGGDPMLPSLPNPEDAVFAAHRVWDTPPKTGYCAGHAGVFRRELIQKCPWTAMPHDRIWDVFASQIQQNMGAQFVWSPLLEVFDLEPEAMPWR